MRGSLLLSLLCLAACGGVTAVTPALPVVYAGLDVNLLTSQLCLPLTLVDETATLEPGSTAEPISRDANVIVVYSQEVTMTCSQYGGDCSEQSRAVRGRAMRCPAEVLSAIRGVEVAP